MEKTKTSQYPNGMGTLRRHNLYWGSFWTTAFGAALGVGVDVILRGGHEILKMLGPQFVTTLTKIWAERPAEVLGAGVVGGIAVALLGEALARREPNK
jgi:hypothetical protein